MQMKENGPGVRESVPCALLGFATGKALGIRTENKFYKENEHIINRLACTDDFSRFLVN